MREIFIMESDKHDSRYGPEYLFEYQAIESAVVTPTNAGPKKCDCDLRSVIMVTGCVCGGC